MSDVVIVETTTGAYLASYDPEAHSGIGETEWTHDLRHALRFPSVAVAHSTYTAQPTCRPVREDQRPNRPLTAFDVMFHKVTAA